MEDDITLTASRRFVNVLELIPQVKMTQIVNIDGKLYPPEDARISVFDHGFLYGDSVYETMRTFQRQLFLIDRHMQRLQNSARML
ncbi:MAG: hypothetical protein C5B54_06020, partial [Acidobacteria bacterium]